MKKRQNKGIRPPDNEWLKAEQIIEINPTRNYHATLKFLKKWFKYTRKLLNKKQISIRPFCYKIYTDILKNYDREPFEVAMLLA